ncbi:ABC transporter substrate-binding protein [Nakamurella sp. YIM 132087]|uniref:ABC transporter substrate-binding protein n=1 Tax=Nakamurella alba TaxID=2665158 RepID=A0A7K1FUT4_9ACTN|nr:ABC transporter substrate-binding protein [Nakamurella alba]MTD17109.1 ABC transporter substrate-binding protein [Nakamurella alba]
MLGSAALRRSAVRGAVAVVLAGSLAACGQENSAGGTSGGAAASGDTVKFMSIAAVGSALTNYPDVDAGAKAAVEAINKAGGINGKQISYQFCNTQGDANQAAACARKAQTEGVAAVVGEVDIYSSQSMPILEAAGIPNIGNLPAGGAIDYENPVSYPLHEGNYGAFTAAPYAFKAAGKKKMAVVALDFAATAAQVEIVNKAIAVSGMPTAGEVKIPAQGVTDYAPYAQQLKDLGVDSALVMLGPTGLQGMYKAVKGMALDVQLAGTVFSFGEAEAQAIGEAADGIWVLSPLPGIHDDQDAAVKQWNEQLTATGVADGDPGLRRAAGLNTWLAFQAAAAVAKTITGPVTAESMSAALKSAKDVDVAGLLTWSPAELGTAALGAFPRLPSSTYRVVTYEGGVQVDADQPEIEEPLTGVR